MNSIYSRENFENILKFIKGKSCKNCKQIICPDKGKNIPACSEHVKNENAYIKKLNEVK